MCTFLLKHRYWQQLQLLIFHYSPENVFHHQSVFDALSPCVIFPRPLVSQVSKMACLEGGAVAKSEMKVASMVVLMVLTFMISWLPYASLAMVVVYDPDVKISPLVGTVPVYLAKSSTVYNPLIYIYLNKQVRYTLVLNVWSTNWRWGCDWFSGKRISTT